MSKIEQLEEQLDSFSLHERTMALKSLVELVNDGQISLPPAGSYINMHCHTFFSFNAYGYSPSKFAWLARKRGLALAGIVDFDVLDGMDEFLEAAKLLNLKACVGLESRVFIPEFADKEITSPGEPGISYYMGVGFPTSKLTGVENEFLTRLKQTARQRNIALMERVNKYLSPVVLDYEADVLPLTPAGNATERHMCTAYVNKARAIFTDKAELRRYWAEKLQTPEEDIDLSPGPALTNLIRARTMKRGGVGYVKPDTGSFPALARMNEFLQASGAIPTLTWLNGLSAGEQEIERLLEVAMSTGMAAVNIIPDRNYTPGVEDGLVKNLYHFVGLAEQLHLPVVVGTEMNSPGQKFVDDFESRELSSLLPVFLKGAHIIYAHSVLQRCCGLGYISSWSQQAFTTVEEKNNFFELVGKKLDPAGEDKLQECNGNMLPGEILDILGKGR